MGEKETVSALVEGGEASAGAPLGPSLGPLGVNIGKVVNEINNKTEKFNGMTVPIEVIVDKETNDFTVEVGTPPVSALIKKELDIESGSGEPHEKKVGDLDMDQVLNIVDMKKGDLVAMCTKSAAKEIIGSCVSMGVTVEGKDPREVQKEIDEGKYEDVLEEE